MPGARPNETLVRRGPTSYASRRDENRPRSREQRKEEEDSQRSSERKAPGNLRPRAARGIVVVRCLHGAPALAFVLACKARICSRFGPYSPGGVPPAMRQWAIDQGIMSGLSGPGYSQDWSYFKDSSGNFREWPWDENELGDYHHLDVANAKKLYDIISNKLRDACGHSFTLNLTELGMADEDTTRFMVDRLELDGWTARLVREKHSIQMCITPTSRHLSSTLPPACTL